MSLNLIKPYFRARMNAIGFSNEWHEAFTTENIPRTRIDKAFHILLGNGSGIRQNQDDQEITIPVGMQLFFLSGRDEEQGRIAAMTEAERIIKEVCAPKNRVTQASDGIKDVRLNSFEAVALDISNDNITLLNIEFEVFYILDFE